MAGPETDQQYMIIAKCSGKALDIPMPCFDKHGTHLIQWTAHGGRNQLFTFRCVRFWSGRGDRSRPSYQIVANNGMVLALAPYSPDSPDLPEFALVTSHDRMPGFIDLHRRLIPWAGPPWVTRENMDVRQLWDLREVEPGHYRITSVAQRGKSVDVSGARHDDHAEIILWRSHHHDNQLFRLVSPEELEEVLESTEV